MSDDSELIPDEGPKTSLFTSMIDGIRDWIRTEGTWWATSFLAHMLGLSTLLLLGTVVAPTILDEAPSFEEAEIPPEIPEQELERFEVGETPIDPTELTTESLTLTDAPQMEQTEQINDDNPVFTERGGGSVTSATTPTLGGLGGFDVKAIGPGAAVRGAGGVGVGVGTGRNAGSGGDGSGFGGRGTGMRKAMVGAFGGTKGSERAVAAALNWLARHQMPDGSWSLGNFRKRCANIPCSGPGSAGSEFAATAFGVLPFLAAGQTHMTKGPYQKNIHGGLHWLIKNQGKDGNLGLPMYSHGLATITLCEAYGLTYDSQIGMAAQKAIDFIQRAQHPTTGGWRYSPGEEGDTSVVGWQVMALKSGQMAGLNVSPAALEGSALFLKSCSSGQYGGMFGYTPGAGGTTTMSAVGLLATQYLGASRHDPRMVEGSAFLMANQPDASGRSIYYWYYATQVMHNQPGPDWDTWNRKMRRILIDSQVKQGCAAGSWDPARPTPDPFGDAGGRIMITSLSCLTLEVYYRYMPLFKLDKPEPEKPKQPAPDAKAAK